MTYLTQPAAVWPLPLPQHGHRVPRPMTERLSHGQESHQGPAQISPSLLHGNHHNCRCRRLRHTKELLINLNTHSEYDFLSLSRSLSLCSRIIEILTYVHSHSSIIIIIIIIVIITCKRLLERRPTVCIHRTFKFEWTRCSNLRY
jgi:hypothetical protein